MTTALQETTIPLWVPPVGFFSDVPMKNLPKDVCPAVYTGDNYAMRMPFDVWGGSAILRDFSPLGAQVYYSGGHENSAGQVNTSLTAVCDFSSLTWYARNAPSKPNPVNTMNADYYAPDGQPYCFHSYCGLQEMPTAWGGGPKGSLVAMFHPVAAGYDVVVCDVSKELLGYSTMPTNQYQNALPSVIRHSATKSMGNFPITCMDEKREGWWSAMSMMVDYTLFIHKSGKVTQYPALFGNLQDGSMIFCKSLDLLITVDGGYSSGDYKSLAPRLINIRDLGKGGPDVQVFTTGPIPSATAGYDLDGTNNYHAPNKLGLQWVDELGCAVGLDCEVTPPNIVTLTPPEGDPKVGTWAWNIVPVTHWDADTSGQNVLQNPINSSWSKFRWVPSLQAFVYCAAADKKPQVINLGGNKLPPPPPVVEPAPVEPANPVPAPVPTSAFAAFKLSSPLTQAAAPFQIGHAFREGDIPAGSFAVTDLKNSVVVPLRKWNDGSLRTAAIIGRVALKAGEQTQVNISRVSVAPVAGKLLTAADIVAAAPSVTVQIGSSIVELSSLLGNPVRTFISTSEMVECHYQVKLDATFYVAFHVRLFVDGRMRVRVVVGNGLMGIARAPKTCAVEIKIGGKVAFASPAYVHSPWARYDVLGWFGEDPKVTPQHDTGYLIQTKIVPNFWKTSPLSEASKNYLKSITGYVPGANLGFSEYMPNTGYQDDIGLMPRWEGLYFTSLGSDLAYQAVIDNARAFNSYAISYADPVTLGPIKIANYPKWSIYGDAQGGSYGESTFKQDGKSSLVFEKAHAPASTFLAGILEADWYFIETCQHNAKTIFLLEDINGGVGTNRVFGGQNRSQGWGMRSLSQAATIYPDSMESEFGDTSEWLVGMCKKDVQTYVNTTVPSSFLGFKNFYGVRNIALPNGATATQCSPWEHNFVSQAISAAVDMQPAKDMEAIKAMANYSASVPVGLVNGLGGKAASYNISIRSDGSSEIKNFTATSWDQVYLDNFGTTKPSTKVLEGTSGSDPSITTGYLSNLLPALSMAVDHGKDGADAAWAWLVSADNFSLQQNANYDEIPQFGIVPRKYSQQAANFIVGASGPVEPVPVPTEPTPVPVTPTPVPVEPTPTPVPPIVVPPAVIGKITTPSNVKLNKLKGLTVVVFNPTTLAIAKKFDAVVASARGVLSLASSSLVKGAKYAASVSDASGNVLVVMFPLSTV